MAKGCREHNRWKATRSHCSCKLANSSGRRARQNGDVITALAADWSVFEATADRVVVMLAQEKRNTWRRQVVRPLPVSVPQVMEEMSVNSTWSRDLRSADLLTQALLRAVEREGAGVLTPTDVTFLCQMVDLDRAPLGSSPEAPGAGTMVSVATNYLKLASMVLEPQTASWWSGPSEDGVRRTSDMFGLLLSLFMVF